MAASKLPAKQICEILNGMMNKEDGFLDSLLGRVSVTGELAELSDVSCNKLDKGYDSSPLGFINALSDSEIGLFTADDKSKRFILKRDADKVIDAEWDKYESDLKEFNEKYGTNHKPAKREK